MKRVLAFILLDGFAPAFLATSLYADSGWDAFITAVGVAVIYSLALQTLNWIVGKHYERKSRHASDTLSLMKGKCPNCEAEVTSMPFDCTCGTSYKVGNDGLARRHK